MELTPFVKLRVYHDDVINWKHFPRYWPFVRGIHRSPVNSPHKGQWRGALIFFLICVWINGWVNNREAGDLRRYRAHYDVSVMFQCCPLWSAVVQHLWEVRNNTSHRSGNSGIYANSKQSLLNGMFSCFLAYHFKGLLEMWRTYNTLTVYIWKWSNVAFYQKWWYKWSVINH